LSLGGFASLGVVEAAISEGGHDSLVSSRPRRTPAPVAQWIERRTSNPRVGGSNPSGRASETAGQGLLFAARLPTLVELGHALDTRGHAETCESSVALSHIGSGTSVPLLDPAPVPGRQWLRHVEARGEVGGILVEHVPVTPSG
jgi:hypothetical protein